MGFFLWLCWDGGRNLNPSLGICSVSDRAGTQSYFCWRPAMEPRVAQAGFKTNVGQLAADTRCIGNVACASSGNHRRLGGSKAVGSAVLDVLKTSTYRENAKRLSKKFFAIAGAAKAAKIVEALL